jgi:hypothetical protein
MSDDVREKAVSTAGEPSLLPPGVARIASISARILVILSCQDYNFFCELAEA